MIKTVLTFGSKSLTVGLINIDQYVSNCRTREAQIAFIMSIILLSVTAQLFLKTVISNNCRLVYNALSLSKLWPK